MDYPSFTNQLFGDERNGTSLKPRNAGKIGTGNRLPPPYQVENDSAINVASRLARGDLRVSEVNAFHLVLVSHYIVDKSAINCFPPPQRAAYAQTHMQVPTLNT